MNLPAAFDKSAERNGPKPALFWGETEYTYEQLRGQARRISSHLRHQLGVQPGDRVGLWLKNCPEFPPALFGILGAGAAVVPINNFLKADEVNYIIQDAGIRVLVTEQAANEQLSKLFVLQPQLRTWAVDNLPGLPDDQTAEWFGRQTESDLAVIIYTSGTTGRPKGAMLSHGNLLCNVESCRQVLQAVDADRFVVVLPMFHSFMLCVGVLLPLLVGGSIVLVRSVHPPKNVLQEIIQRQATILPAIPQFFRALASASAPGELPLRVCLSGGAPLPAEILREFNQRMPLPLLEGYGLSEASPVVSINPLQGPWKAGSIGVPIPGVEVTVQDEAGNILEPHMTGEICVRGGNVMLGYWNQPEETAKTLQRGWLLTGDIGHRDEDGYFYITDRKKDMLLVNGINVYPREIEEVLYRYPGIKEAAVIGVADARKGEQPLAFVAVQDGATIEEKPVLQFLREHLADYKVPRRLIILPQLPRNATGKVLKTALRQMSVAGR